ncbi:uncharacterized protein METZ01_LOCUS98730, partial [marine metagenome]
LVLPWFPLWRVSMFIIRLAGQFLVEAWMNLVVRLSLHQVWPLSKRNQQRMKQQMTHPMVTPTLKKKN